MSEKWMGIGQRSKKVDCEISKLVSEYRLHIAPGPDEPIRIRIYKHQSVGYYALSNYSIQTIGAASPYQSSNPQETEELAFSSAAAVFLAAGPEDKWCVNKDY